MKLTQENLKKELLSLNDSERRKIYDKAQEIAYSRNLAIDGQKLPFITVPFLVEKTFMDDVLKKFDTLTEALILLEKYALSPSGKAVYDRLMDSLTEGGRELVNQCKFESDFSLKRRHRRFDSYISPSSRTASVIEVNQAAPLALSYHDTVQEIGDTILDAAGFQMQKRGVAESLLQWFIDEYQERNPKQLPKRVALVIEHGYPPKLTDLPMISERIMKLCNEKFGYDLDIITCFPYEITLKGSDEFFSR
ncbi:MAG: hypothetical protein GY786_18760 [Proteobacteria bacterium]|nr:hypothetical protein [Pseudomonadota bacterium]